MSASYFKYVATLPSVKEGDQCMLQTKVWFEILCPSPTDSIFTALISFSSRFTFHITWQPQLLLNLNVRDEYEQRNSQLRGIVGLKG